MGGIVQQLAKVAEDVALPELRSNLRSLTTSFMGELEHSPIGKSLAEVWRSSYEPLYKKLSAEATGPIMEQFKAKAITPEVARKAISDANNAAKKSARAQVFGAKDEAIIGVLKKAQEQGGVIHANNIANHLSMQFGTTSGAAEPFRVRAKKMGVSIAHIEAPFSKTSKFEKNVRNAMSWSFTPRIAIPHLSQILNSTVSNGVSSTVKAISEYIGNPEEFGKMVQKTGAFEEELFHVTKNLDNWFSKLFHQPGFNWVRKHQIAVSALAGKHSAMDAFEELMSNPKSLKAKIQLTHLGLNPDTLREAGKLSQDDLEKAMYRGAADTMFFRSAGGGSPFKWQQDGFKRAMWWYKDFLFNQTRFMKEAIKRDFRKGNAEGIKTIAWIATAFPVVGEVIHSLENAATGNNPFARPEEDKFNTPGVGKNEYIDAVAHAAGLGMGYSIMRAAKRNGLADYFAGPLYSTGMDLYQDAQAGRGRAIGRTILMKAGVGGPALANIIVPKETPKERARKAAQTRKAKANTHYY